MLSESTSVISTVFKWIVLPAHFSPPLVTMAMTMRLATMTEMEVDINEENVSVDEDTIGGEGNTNDEVSHWGKVGVEEEWSEAEVKEAMEMMTIGKKYAKKSVFRGQIFSINNL